MGAAWLVLGGASLGCGAWLAARRLFRIDRFVDCLLAAAVLAWGWITLGMEILGTLGWLSPPVLVGWSTAGLALAGLVGWLVPHGAAATDPPEARVEPPGLAAAIATGMLLWAGLRLGLIALVYPIKVVSDGPIYHLYMAARWWKAGRLELVATPFGELGATYFWANGELWYAWLLILVGGDRLARLGQVPFLILILMAITTIARQLGARTSSARIAAVWFGAITPGFIFAFEPNVDTILVAGYLLAVAFLLRAFRAVGGLSVRCLILGSLAAGLGMGTKPTGIVFFPPLLMLAAVGVWLRGAGHWRERCVGLMAALVPAFAMMGYWPIRNALLTGNPLYPIHVEAWGRVWLAGWFRPEAMTRSPYHVPWLDWRSAFDLMLSVADPRQVPLWLAAAVGLWAGRAPQGRDRATTDRWVWGCTLLAVFNLAAYWFVIPYRTQQRFSFPAMALLTIPLARLLDRAGWLRAVAVGLLILHFVTPQTWPIATHEADIPWDGNRLIPNALPGTLDLPTTLAGWEQQRSRPALWVTGLLGIGAAGAVGWWRFRRWVALAWLIPCTVGSASLLGAWNPPLFPYFVDYYAGWVVLEAHAGREGARVAYAGHKIPYYLMGSKLQNNVRYINIDAHPNWLLHDYHRTAASRNEPTTWGNPFPAWGRLRPDYDAWLANLHAARIDLLVVTRVNIEEGIENVADPERFPVERGWAESHPESFRAIYGVAPADPRFRIYQVLPGGSKQDF